MSGKEKRLRIAQLRIDGGTQMRAEIDQAVVEDYAEQLDELPPVEVFFDGASFWLAEGFHRYHAHRRKLGPDGLIRCVVCEGTLDDAIEYAAAANKEFDSQGLRRKPSDKRRAVLALLRLSRWQGRSDRLIAAHCGVSYELVRTIRAETGDQKSPDAAPPPRVGMDGKVRSIERRLDLSQIGKPPQRQPQQPTPPPEPESEPESPFESFNAQLDQLIREARALKRSIEALLDFESNGKRATVKWGAAMSRGNTTDYLSFLVDTLAKDRPGRMGSDPLVSGSARRGYLTVREIEHLEAMKRAS